jgi:uncharacterized protein YhfF
LQDEKALHLDACFRTAFVSGWAYVIITYDKSKKQTIRGFWLLFWYQSAKPDEITAMFDHLAALIAAGTISASVAATYSFDQVREAITKAAQSGGKVLFTPKTRGSTRVLRLKTFGSMNRLYSPYSMRD